MISMIMILNQKGDIIISRQYRDDSASRSAADAFRLQVVAAKETGNGDPPIKRMGGGSGSSSSSLLDTTGSSSAIAASSTATASSFSSLSSSSSSFLYTRFGHNLYMVAHTRANVHPALVFEYLFQFIKILKAYLGEPYFGEEAALRNHMTLIYELLDETMDFGYPQNTSVDVLRLYINLGTASNNINNNKNNEPELSSQLTSQITGAIDWRRENIRHKKNEVYIDVVESVNLLLSPTGALLRSEVTGAVHMNTKLTGMPECKFGLNDKLVIDKDNHHRTTHEGTPGNNNNANSNKPPGVEISDCTFHRCVRLGKFEADRTITFIPPDGEFELMRYRVSDHINLPFRIIPAVQEEQNMTKVSINLKVIANFSDQLFATHVVIKIPVPKNTSKAKVKHTFGRAKYEPEQQAIVWRVKRFAGKAECILNADVDLMPATVYRSNTNNNHHHHHNNSKVWTRPPITMEFQVPMFTSSGVHVRFLRVYDKSGYHTNRWVRYITKAGSYQIRI